MLSFGLFESVIFYKEIGLDLFFGKLGQTHSENKVSSFLAGSRIVSTSF